MTGTGFMNMQQLQRALERAEAENLELRAENERHRRANLVRAVTQGHDEWVTEAIHAEKWDAIPWRVAENTVRTSRELRDELCEAEAVNERLVEVIAAKGRLFDALLYEWWELELWMIAEQGFGHSPWERLKAEAKRKKWRRLFDLLESDAALDSPETP